MRTLRAIPFIMFIMAVCAAVLAQNRDTSYFPCTDQQRGLGHIEGPVLASPDGQWQAYVRAEADMRKPGNAQGLLQHHVAFVKASGAATFESVYVKRPEPHLQGNGLKLIAWSHKGHVLAAELTCWQYASDFGGVSQFLYDADGERAWEITSQAPPSIRQSLPCRPTPARPGKGTERCEQCSSREADRSLER